MFALIDSVYSSDEYNYIDKSKLGSTGHSMGVTLQLEVLIILADKRLIIILIVSYTQFMFLVMYLH